LDDGGYFGAEATFLNARSSAFGSSASSSFAASLNRLRLLRIVRLPFWLANHIADSHVIVDGYGESNMQELLQLIRHHEEAVRAYNMHLPNADAKFEKKLLREREREMAIIASLKKLIH
jgi:hypothetical protein